MINFFPKDNNSPGNLTGFDWNYITYWGDGIPLLFWVFAYPYGSVVTNGLSATKANANEYKWHIYNDYTNKSTRYNNANNPIGDANSFLQFPSNIKIQSNTLYNLTRGSNELGPYNYKDAVIIVDSPWARSCANRIPAPESKKNENYAVGVSFDMGNRIAKTYNTWSKWWDNLQPNCSCEGNQTVSLLPPYLKSAIQKAAGNLTSVIENVEILMFDPTFNTQYSSFEEQAGLVLPELAYNDAIYGPGNGVAWLGAAQCSISQYSFPTHPFGKAFVGAFVAMYKDYIEYDVAVVNGLLIDVPWSGVLTGVQTYKMNQKMGGDFGTECSLNCPVPLDFNPSARSEFCDGEYPQNYTFTNYYSAPFTLPRVGCVGSGTASLYDPCVPDVNHPNAFLINNIWRNPDGSFKVDAGDGVANNNYLYPAYDIGTGPWDVNYQYFIDPTGGLLQNPLILPKIGPWIFTYKIDFSRFRIAGGGCQNFFNSSSFYPWQI